MCLVPDVWEVGWLWRWLGWAESRYTHWDGGSSQHRGSQCRETLIQTLSLSDVLVSKLTSVIRRCIYQVNRENGCWSRGDSEKISGTQRGHRDRCCQQGISDKHTFFSSFSYLCLRRGPASSQRWTRAPAVSTAASWAASWPRPPACSRRWTPAMTSPSWGSGPRSASSWWCPTMNISSLLFKIISTDLNGI